MGAGALAMSAGVAKGVPAGLFVTEGARFVPKLQARETTVKRMKTETSAFFIYYSLVNYIQFAIGYIQFKLVVFIF